MNYTSGVTYTGGPFRFTFIFGASQVGTFNIVVTQANTTEARVQRFGELVRMTTVGISVFPLCTEGDGETA